MKTTHNTPTTLELDAEVLRALTAANYAFSGANLPTDPKTVALIRAFLHSGDFELRLRGDEDAKVRVLRVRYLTEVIERQTQPTSRAAWAVLTFLDAFDEALR